MYSVMLFLSWKLPAAGSCVLHVLPLMRVAACTCLDSCAWCFLFKQLLWRMWWYLPWKYALPVSMKEDHSSRIRDRPLFRSRIHKRPCFQDPWKTTFLWPIKAYSFMICEDHSSRTFRFPIFNPVSMKGRLFMTHRRPLFHDSWKPIPPWSTKDPSLRILKNHPSRIQETSLVPGSRKHLCPRIWEGPLCQDAGRTTLPGFRKDHCQDAGSATLPGCRNDHSIRI